MSYKFWCSRCKFDHAGECEKIEISINVDPLSAEKSRQAVQEITDTIRRYLTTPYQVVKWESYADLVKACVDDQLKEFGGKVYQIDDIRIQGDYLAMTVHVKMPALKYYSGCYPINL